MRYPALIGLISTLYIMITSVLSSPAFPVLEKRVTRCRSKMGYKSTYQGTTSRDSPHVRDCRDLVKIMEDADMFFLMGDAKKVVAKVNTCTFNAMSPEGLGFTTLGNDEILLVVKESIRRFSRNGRVGAKGTIKNCQGVQDVDAAAGFFKLTRTVNWSITHTRDFDTLLDIMRGGDY
jgi:hypothetical protein